MSWDVVTAAAQACSSAMVEQLTEFVNCESPSNSVRHLEVCAALLEPWVSDAVRRQAGVERVDGKVHVVSRAPNPRVLVLGHFDTVWPLGTTADWPFSLDPATGIGSGPGTFDMKAGIVQALTAIELLADPEHVSVLWTSDEEIGSATSRALIGELASEAGAVLVCEPSADGGAVKVARKGIANYAVDVRGRAAHAGLEPERGVNAGVEMARQILRLVEFADPVEQTSVVPTILAAGTTSNTVPETARLHVDARAWTVRELERVDAAMSGMAAISAGASVRVSGGIERPPFEEHMARGLYAQAVAAAAEIGLGRLDGVRSGGGSDGNLTAAAGVATLDGLGAVGGHPHARDEHVVVTRMPERAALLSVLLRRLGSEASAV